jgi:hypothetical protein
MTFIRIVLVVVLAGSLGACSDEPESAPSQAKQASTGDEKDRGKGGKSARPDRSPNSDDRGRSDEGDADDEGRDDDGGGGEGGDDSGSPGQDPATESASVPDRTGDGEGSGEVPAYTDIVGGAIEGRGRTVRLSITFSDRVPPAMPDDDTVMSVETTIDRGGTTYRVYADGDSDGWSAYIARKGDSRALLGAFRIDGSRTIFDVAWGRVGGPGRFKWSVQSSWTRSTLTRTDFSFDRSPGQRMARFPRS